MKVWICTVEHYENKEIIHVLDNKTQADNWKKEIDKLFDYIGDFSGQLWENYLKKREEKEPEFKKLGVEDSFQWYWSRVEEHQVIHFHSNVEAEH